jgi:hypothetical protein
VGRSGGRLGHGQQLFSNSTSPATVKKNVESTPTSTPKGKKTYAKERKNNIKVNKKPLHWGVNMLINR